MTQKHEFWFKYLFFLRGAHVGQNIYMYKCTPPNGWMFVRNIRRGSRDVGCKVIFSEWCRSKSRSKVMSPKRQIYTPKVMCVYNMKEIPYGVPEICSGNMNVDCKLILLSGVAQKVGQRS